ncbi:hypothetical protein [Bdellovibrio sp. HCB337]|uniref:hypothetical protein n=1 Tax=Bdellovibrio sp. HCB337 TaxID=3394358 RepID=UPI0039A77EC7
MGNKHISFDLKVFALGTAFTLVLGVATHTRAATADYYKCNDRVGGEYNYGRAPQACNANAFGEDRFVVNTYGTLIFNDSEVRASERSRYVDEMNAVIRDAATYYMKKRKPAVSSTELSWWLIGVQATASHESYWSHYRKATDARIKMMRGDYGHGHGMMQIDDRAHFSVIDSGIAWNLISNLTYAMDIYYKQWERAPSQSCVKSATDYEARVRSAWAAYNGGAGKICRWKNPNDKWAQNDKNFYEHYSKRLWQKHVTNANKKASIDVACLIEKKENCPAPGSGESTTLKPGVLYKNASGVYCVVNNNKASCVNEARDAICLKVVSDYSSNEATLVKDSVLANYAPVTLDRHKVCPQYENTLYAVGTQIEVLKNTNLRATPGGGIVSVIPQNQVLSVLDFELRNAPANDRYYKVKFQNKEGYIFAGNKTDYQSWAVVDESNSWPATLARVGETVKIINAAGINQRTAPGGELIRLIPKNTQLQVYDVFVESSNNKVYYKVSYQGQVGYIYTGFILPTDTTAEWTQVLR